METEEMRYQNKEMNSKAYFIFIVILILSACGPRTGTSGTDVDHPSPSKLLDLNQVNYVKNVFDIGPKIFKSNCVPCHCGPYSRCEPPYSGELRAYFSGLPMDSLEHYEAFIKNSDPTKKGLRKNPYSSSDIPDYHHEFENTLSDSLVKTVIEFLWLGYKYRET